MIGIVLQEHVDRSRGRKAVRVARSGSYVEVGRLVVAQLLLSKHHGIRGAAVEVIAPMVLLKWSLADIRWIGNALSAPRASLLTTPFWVWKKYGISAPAHCPKCVTDMPKQVVRSGDWRKPGAAQPKAKAEAKAAAASPPEYEQDC